MVAIEGTVYFLDALPYGQFLTTIEQMLMLALRMHAQIIIIFVQPGVGEPLRRCLDGTR